MLRDEDATLAVMLRTWLSKRGENLEDESFEDGMIIDRRG
jgi:hypothetical protein